MRKEKEDLDCSLSPAEQAVRSSEFGALDHALVGCERLENGVRLAYRDDPGLVAALDELVRKEAECCPFLAFTVDAGDGKVGVTITAPAGAEALFDAILGLAGGARSG